jgi:LmbE family N-acetylglucosaminyl deacetylase
MLVLAPHTDDGEFGCGGTIAKFIEDGKEVYYAAFSLAEKSVSFGYPVNILEKELKEATRVLGIPKDNLIIHKYEVRRFSLFRQEILENLVLLEKELKPDIVFLPTLNDLHQDHSTIAREGLRAFKKTTILAYEIPWNNVTFQTLSFIFLQERHINKKIEALKCYESQSHRYYANEEFIRSLARTRATQIGTEYAEAFEVLRLIVDKRI